MIWPIDRKARARGALEERRTLREVDVVLERPRHDERRVVGRVRVAERVDVVGERPACSGSVTASKNDGIGVPLRPVLKVRKMSSRFGPPRNVQRRVRSAARIGWPSRP